MCFLCHTFTSVVIRKLGWLLAGFLTSASIPALPGVHTAGRPLTVAGTDGILAAACVSASILLALLPLRRSTGTFSFWCSQCCWPPCFVDFFCSGVQLLMLTTVAGVPAVSSCTWWHWRPFLRLVSISLYRTVQNTKLNLLDYRDHGLWDNDYPVSDWWFFVLFDYPVSDWRIQYLYDLTIGYRIRPQLSSSARHIWIDHDQIKNRCSFSDF